MVKEASIDVACQTGEITLHDVGELAQAIRPSVEKGNKEFIRKIWALLLWLIASTSNLNLPREEQSEHERWQVEHPQECIEYLRQKIMCMAEYDAGIPRWERPG